MCIATGDPSSLREISSTLLHNIQKFKDLYEKW